MYCIHVLYDVPISVWFFKHTYSTIIVFIAVCVMFFSSSTLRLFDFSRAESCHRFDPLNVPGELVRALQQKHERLSDCTRWLYFFLSAKDIGRFVYSGFHRRAGSMLHTDWTGWEKIDREISGILRCFSVSLRSWRLPPNNTVTETSVRGSCLAFESV